MSKTTVTKSVVTTSGGSGTNQDDPNELAGGAEERNMAEPKKDRGHIGFLVIFFVLVAIAVGLLAGVMIYRQRYNVCRYNPVVFCPYYVCADGSNPVDATRTSLEMAGLPVGMPVET